MVPEDACADSLCEELERGARETSARWDEQSMSKAGIPRAVRRRVEVLGSPAEIVMKEAKKSYIADMQMARNFISWQLQKPVCA